jgi:hypothetical protein
MKIATLNLRRNFHRYMEPIGMELKHREAI